MFDFKGNIEQIREIYKTKHPKLKDYLKKPYWMSYHDLLNHVFSTQDTLYNSGNIYYAGLLQANSFLFKRHPSLNCPADIIYSTDSYFDENPQELAAIARELFKYKNTTNAPPDVKRVVDAITNEMERLFNIDLPRSITGDKKVYYTTIMVFRKHIPKKRLISNIFPIMAMPETLQSSIILPHYYWTESLKQYYCQE